MLFKIKHIFCSLIFLSAFSIQKIFAQECILKDTAINIDFGSNNRVQDFSFSNLKSYRRITGNCPDDGMFSFVSSTENCYSDHWHTLFSDHTYGDVSGKMMLVNASYSPSTFFSTSLNGLKPNTRYELSLWILNICRVNNDCTATIPDIMVKLFKPDNSAITQFRTSGLYQTTVPVWQRYFSIFTTPADISSVTLLLYNNAPGGCGNDFALDDITFRECYLPPPPPPAIVKTIVPKIAPPKPVARQEVKEMPMLKKNNVQVNNIPSKETVITQGEIKRNVQTPVVPDAIRTRENLLARKITVVESELKIELYDNGTIDGDTVSIYHNNKMIVSRGGLSEKPIVIRIKVNKNEPHHELIMVAENLGSIPPNTSLMVVTSKDKRDEVFISSTKQQNAKLVIDLKE